MTSPVIQFKRGSYSQLPGLRSGEPGFTTDRYDLFVGLTSSLSDNKFFGSHRYWRREDGTTSLRFAFVDKDGDNNIQIKSPNTLAGVTTYTLPETPIDTFFLKTDANGVLSWSNDFPSLVIDNVTVSGISTFESRVDITDTTESYNKDTGALVIDGGVGIEKNLNVGGRLHVTGISTFVGSVTFEGGTINLGDETTDNINVGGEFISNLTPNTDNTYDIGITTQRWRDAHFSGIGSFSTGVYADSIRLGIAAATEIDTVSGDLVLNPASGKVNIQNHLDVYGDINCTGNVSVGGTTITLRGEDVFIENKDIILGYTTSVLPNDDSANHAGVAIASTEGTPLVSFSVSGVNTLPDTYKQLMWFQSGTLGFLEDMFAFNYGVAIGTTVVANGVRFAVGPNISFTESTIFTQNFSASGVSTFTGLVDANGGAEIDNIRIGIADNNEIDTSTGNLTLDAATDLVVVDSNLSVSGVSTFTGLVDANGGAEIDDIRIGVAANNEIDTSAGNLVLDSASGMTYIDDDLTIAGNLYINGSTTQVNTTEITVEDRTIELGKVDGNAPTTATTWDLGVLFNYHDGSAKKSGVVWENSTGRFTFASNVTDSGGTGNSNPQITYNAYAPIEISALWVNDCAGQSQVISCTGNERFLENITIDGGSF